MPEANVLFISVAFWNIIFHKNNLLWKKKVKLKVVSSILRSFLEQKGE